jgi:hypothetical protein
MVLNRDKRIAAPALRSGVFFEPVLILAVHKWYRNTNLRISAQLEIFFNDELVWKTWVIHAFNAHTLYFRPIPDVLYQFIDRGSFIGRWQAKAHVTSYSLVDVSGWPSRQMLDYVQALPYTPLGDFQWQVLERQAPPLTNPDGTFVVRQDIGDLRRQSTNLEDI